MEEGGATMTIYYHAVVLASLPSGKVGEANSFSFTPSELSLSSAGFGYQDNMNVINEEEDYVGVSTLLFLYRCHQ